MNNLLTMVFKYKKLGNTSGEITIFPTFWNLYPRIGQKIEVLSARAGVGLQGREPLY